LKPSTCEHLLDKAQIDPMRRAERLSVEEFVRLSNVIGAYRKIIDVGE
jgi:16S rRNA A1518/A1519 N6-dimethyltransferase RsmA/KsgA/DIM1 with predicted DNA glycosylase/AP lyase activity